MARREQQTIIQIERREVVAEIVEDPFGEGPPAYHMAFTAAASVMAEEMVPDRPMTLTWQYAGRTFSITGEMTEDKPVGEVN